MKKQPSPLSSKPGKAGGVGKDAESEVTGPDAMKRFKALAKKVADVPVEKVRAAEKRLK